MDLTKYKEIEHHLEKAYELICVELKYGVVETPDKAFHLMEACRYVNTTREAMYCALMEIHFKPYRNKHR